MKKFVLAFGIPVLAVASLIGSGYATWYFNSDVVTNKKDIAVEPSGGKAAGAMLIPSDGDIKLVLDQTDDVKNDGFRDDRLGVHFEGAFIESLIADVDGDAKTTDKFVNGTSYIVTTTITIPSAVARYVNFTLRGKPNEEQPDDQTSSTTKLTLTKQYTLTVEDDAKEKFDFFNISPDTTNSNVTVAYVKEPSTLAEYNAMVDALTPTTGKPTIGISFAAEIVVNNK